LTPEESSTKRSPLLSSFVRPRRKFELGVKDVKEVVTEKSTEKTDDENVTENDSAEITTTFSPNTIESAFNTLSLLPTPRPLPKDLKLPFGKNGGRFKPTLLSFSVEKKKPLVKPNNSSQIVGDGISISTALQVETTTIETVDEISTSQDADESALAKISSLKRKFQFGRKAFGKLVGPKGPEVTSVPSTSSTSSNSTSNSSTFDPNTPPAPHDVPLTPEISFKVF
jgi:hypothetical protein